jgi:hypothetical protein
MPPEPYFVLETLPEKVRQENRLTLWIKCRCGCVARGVTASKAISEEMLCKVQFKIVPVHLFTGHVDAQ